jgi:hypothetical protein
MTLRSMAVRLAAVSIVLVASFGIFAERAIGAVIREIPARTVLHKAGQIGGRGGFMDIYQLPPRTEYYLDYTLVFRPGFDWTERGRPRGGKLPGLGGGSGTGGCRRVEPAGWSARQTWGADGTASLYLYHQTRNNRCGDKIDYRLPNGQLFRFVTNKRYRLTQRVRVNSPGASNGEIQIWVDGVSVLQARNLRLRGNVAANAGLVSQVKYHSYFGGAVRTFAPANNSYIDYGPMFVMTCMPNFRAIPGRCG